MKKTIMFLILVFFASPFMVRAIENKLYFTGSGDRLYYNTDLYDEDIFMHHTDMVPGGSYEDELIIANNTRTTYKLYMRALIREQSEVAIDLLKNIEMTIYLDGKLLYDGYADGLDYTSSGINLQNSIYIGEYGTDKVSKVVVKTRLNPEYSNTENDEFSYVDWEFVANYEDDLIVINPDTGDHYLKYLKYLVFALLIIGFLYILMKWKYKNS